MVRCGGLFTNCLRRMMCTSKKVPEPPAPPAQQPQPAIPLQTQPQKKPDIVITMDPKKIVTYEELLEVIKTPSKYLIDVRNPDEIKETGKIPSSINIPLPVLGEVLSPSMSNEDFTQQYQRPKPTSSDELIFTCQSGRRATSALETALKLGYPNSKNYTGSWKEWASRQNL